MLDRLVWQGDRVLLDDLVFRLQHFLDDQWELGDECFIFFKTKPLVEEYARFWSKAGFQPRNFLELGIWDGGSVVFWHEYFHPHKHVAIDLKPRQDSEYFRRYLRTRGLGDRIKTYWGTDQADAARLGEIVTREFDGPLDLVIDDASHQYGPTKVSFETLFPLLRPGGCYVIEDWAWAHWDKFQAPEHPWSNRIALTELIFELIEALGSRMPFIASLNTFTGFAVVERSGIAASPSDHFALEQSSALARREQVVRAQLARVETLAVELKLSRAQLAWKEEQLRQMRATRWWRLGTLYWQTYARIKALLRR